MTSCFVVMGFNTKKIPNTNIEVDLNQVYNNLGNYIPVYTRHKV